MIHLLNPFQQGVPWAIGSSALAGGVRGATAKNVSAIVATRAPGTTEILFHDIASLSPQVEEVAIVRFCDEARSNVAIYDLVKDAHSGDEVLDGKGPALVMEEGEVGVLQSIHVEVERILAAIGLEHASHRTGRGAREISEQDIPAPRSRRQRPARNARCSPSTEPDQLPAPH